MNSINASSAVFLSSFVAFVLCFGQDGRTRFPEIPPSVLAPAAIEWDGGQDPMASRLFRTTTSREQISLGGLWDFVTDPKGAGEERGYAGAFPRPETQLWVPGSWNTQARYWQYEGPAWLSRTFDVPRDGLLRIRFGGVFYLCRVYLDGEAIGDHEGGYLPFSFVKSNVRKGRHRITVRVDNRLGSLTVPKAGVDWFPYGGIFRPVYAELVPGLFIDNFHVVPAEVAPARVSLDVRVFVRNLAGGNARERIAFEINGRQLHAEVHSLEGGSPEVRFRVALDSPHLWSPSDPYLYGARVVLGEGRDDQFTRIGIRSFTTRGPAVFLNGSRFKLMGANHHDDHPDWGSALAPHILRNDVEIIKRMGANAVRSHYPPDDMLLDYCDQNGLVFMNEVPAWQHTYEQLSNPAVQQLIKDQFRDMVYRDMNHPSIFSWSLGNEWPDFTKSYDAIQSLVAYARSVDSSHFVTFVTGGAKTDRSTALIDIICTNWAQYQWYDPFTTLDEEEGKKSLALLDRIHERFPDKPVVLTEFGGAESQAGWHNWGNVKWSEEYQARNVADSGRYGLEQEWISGGCVWQFCDTRSAPSRFLAGRLHGWNAKGVVDAYRSPKTAFYSLQELFRSHPAGERP